MKIFIENKEIELTDKLFVSSGGEGNIYHYQDKAIKIYHKTSLINREKIKELSIINHKNVISPIDIIKDNSGQIIGYTMSYVNDSFALCQLFTKSFKARNNITPNDIIKLIQNMQNTINHIHKKDILIVDLNENNFLLNNKFSDVYFIDVDSYQTKNFPATAIMHSIQDVHSSSFSVLTDWFSFGIISFQMMIGIHPYKGKHPEIKKLKDRMKNNIPVFHKDVRFPRTCMPFDIIPDKYKQWYNDIFYKGKRLPPPEIQDITITMPTVVIDVKSSDTIKVSLYEEYDSNITDMYFYNNKKVIVTQDKNIYIDKNKIIDNDFNGVIITPKNKKTIGYKFIKPTNREMGEIVLSSVENSNIIENKKIKANDIIVFNNRLYIKQEEQLLELILMELPNGRTIFSSQIVANIHKNASKIFDGVIIQDLIGTYMASILPHSKQCFNIILSELKSHKVINAKYNNNVLCVITYKDGQYNKLFFILSKNYKEYKVYIIKDISNIDINFIVLDNGTVIHDKNNDDIELFTNDYTSNKVSIISKDDLKGDLKLFTDGINIFGVNEKTIYKINFQKIK